MKLRERFYLASLLWAALLILPAPAAWAADADLDSKARDLDQGVTTREAKSAIFTKFGIPNSPPFNTLPPGQALVLFSLCGKNTACQTQALADRKAGKGWGEIAKGLGKKVGPAVSAVTDAHRDLMAKDEKAKAEKLEKAEKMQRMDPGRAGR